MYNKFKIIYMLYKTTYRMCVVMVIVSVVGSMMVIVSVRSASGLSRGFSGETSIGSNVIDASRDGTDE